MAKRIKKAKVVKLGYKSWVKRTVVELRDYLFLQGWEIDILYGSEIESTASIDVFPNYMKAVIKLSDHVKEAFDEGEYYFLVGVLVHEFSHILTEPLYIMALAGVNDGGHKHLESVREKQTTHTAHVIVKALPKSFYRTGK